MQSEQWCYLPETHDPCETKIRTIKNKAAMKIHVQALCGYNLQFMYEDVRSPGTGVTDSFKLPYGCWALNLVPLEEKPVLLTAEPSLQPHT
ncbi:hypothetical protein STEG23_020461, partial [Scotinomys teguina]